MTATSCRVCGQRSAHRADCPLKPARSLRALPHTNPVGVCLQVEQLQKGLCGVSRPHFFRGVATVSVSAVLLWWAGSPSSRGTPAASRLALRAADAAAVQHGWTASFRSCCCLVTQG